MAHLLQKAEHVHLVGIGGIGLSAIARVLQGRGHVISGSDECRTGLTDELAALGMAIHIGHRAEHVQGADLVVVSSAVPHDNVEVITASENGTPVLKRAQILGELMEGRIGIAVAGTHGKTTTSALAAFVLCELGLDPTYIVGGILQNTGTNARQGNGPHFVVEADEYDRTFLGLAPRIAVVTAIDMDHPDCYRDMADMALAYEQFLKLVPQDGAVIGCGNHPRVRELVQRTGRERGFRVVTYGFAEDAFWRARQARANSAGGSDFEVLREGRIKVECSLRLPGLHNVANALAVLAIADVLNLDIALVTKAMGDFTGVRRRFELKGEAGGIAVVDDYAHHPTEIQATLAAARQRYGLRPLWVFFQPHTYTRTKALLDEFAASFGNADHVIVSPIYGSREYDNLGLSARDLTRRMAHPDVRAVDSLQEAGEQLLTRLQQGDVLLTLGAGDGYQVGEAVLQALRERDKCHGCSSAGGRCCEPALFEVAAREH